MSGKVHSDNIVAWGGRVLCPGKCTLITLLLGGGWVSGKVHSYNIVAGGGVGVRESALL